MQFTPTETIKKRFSRRQLLAITGVTFLVLGIFTFEFLDTILLHVPGGLRIYCGRNYVRFPDSSGNGTALKVYLDSDRIDNCITSNGVVPPPEGIIDFIHSQ